MRAMPNDYSDCYGTADLPAELLEVEMEKLRKRLIEKERKASVVMLAEEHR